MARYIDAEDLKNIIEANSWSNPVVPQVVCTIIDRSPTADVVPKSDVVAIIEAVLEDKVETAVKEIFDEIEKLMNSLDGRYMASGNPKQSWGIRGAMAEIAELKKKYTEGEQRND